jgi:hypothetical protein
LDAEILQKFDKNVRPAQVLVETTLLLHVWHESSDPIVEKFGMLDLILLTFALSASSS